jgi:hypothetical protein
MPSDAKDREYAELGRNLVQLAAAMEETVQLMEFVRADLQAMASIGANTASQCVLTRSRHRRARG